MDFGSGEYAVGGEVDEAFLAGFQLGELLGEGGVQFAGEPLLVGHGGFQFGADGVGEVLGHGQQGVVGGDGVLDLGDG
ncbi:hypothetical protein [Jatrophihabitans lederbergiae]|uniref:hypothetical protein n=1 Tax=Jatrophihabitans lederbergiae TaxID=3075547 RepID=UPI00288A83D0|nr:hypothetical protein [Jatrophihabitans sp. DSM 44399]